MSAPTILNVDPRTRIGHANVKLAPEGLVPAIVYGSKIDPLPVSIARRDLEAALAAHGGSMLVDLKVAGKAKKMQALVREIQRHPISRVPIHVDFLAVDAGTPVTTTVAFVAVGEPVGVRIDGGVLNVEQHEVSLEALPADLPERVEFDVTELGIGGVVTVADLTVPEGVTILSDPETVLCSIMTPQLVVEASTEEVEPRLVGDEKEAE